MRKILEVRNNLEMKMLKRIGIVTMGARRRPGREYSLPNYSPVPQQHPLERNPPYCELSALTSHMNVIRTSL